MNNALRVLIFVLVMGTVSGALLVGVNSFTAPLIAKNEELKLKSSVLDAFDIPYNKTNLESMFEETVNVSAIDKYKFYKASDGSLAFEFYGPGLWGAISGIISLEKNLKTIRRIKVTHQEETPGLGGRIADSEYLKQFKNKEVLPKLVFMPQGHAVNKNEVDAITGATGSSRAFEKLINENVQRYLSMLKN